MNDRVHVADRPNFIRSSKCVEQGSARTEQLFKQISLDMKRSKRSGENHHRQYIKMERGSPPDVADPSLSAGMKGVFSTKSAGYASFASNSSFGENPTASGVMKKLLISLHKNTTGHDPDDKALAEISWVIQGEPERPNICNETRWVEKLKLHLIKQGREKDAKRVMELHQKLKGMTIVKNRENMIGLMYNLFDKEATLTLMASSRKPHAQISVNKNPKKSHVYAQELSLDCKSESSRDHDEVVSVEIGNVCSSSGSRHYLKHGRPKVSGYAFTNITNKDDEYTPIPQLHSASEELLNQDLVSDTKVPSLLKPATFKWIESKKECNWDKSSHLDSMNRGGGPPTWQSVSTISKGLDEFPRNLPSGVGSVADSSHLVVASTPIDHPNANNRQKPYVNFRRTQENHSVSIRDQSASVRVQSTSTAHAFASTKSMERDLIRDIVFILQGIDGNFIKTTSKGTFEIFTKQFVHPTLRLHTMKLCELGYCYTKIRSYCDKSTSGLMAQGFKQAIEKELQEYYRLLAVIQEKIQQVVVDTPLTEDLPISKMRDMTMLKLTVWLFECRPRLQVLARMVESCDSKRGGELCSVIHKYSQHGDPLVRDLTVSLLSTVCKPLYIMLSQWILYGELEDPFSEFFIAGDPICLREQLWHLKYRIRSEMLPSFISMKQAEKILAIGKNINFLKEICNNADEFEGRHEVKALLESGAVESLFWGENSPIQYAIEMSYKTTSEKVLKVLINDSNLLVHLKAIKKYLLLGQGDFIQYFLELIQDELSKPASKLYNHNISAILESAVRATNAQFENEDILSRLDTRILPSSDKDQGWDVFCLDYKVHGPIGTVLTEDVIISYNKLFNSLWRTKRIEIILSTLWKNQTVLFKYLRLIPELAPVLHRSQLLISEMIHFVHQTQYYIMFEATECAWERLMEDVNKASDLDEVITSHKKFLDTIFKRSLLDGESRDLLNQLRGIFDSVHELKAFLKEFNDRVEVEVKNRKDLQPNTEEVRSAQRQFFASYVMQAKGKIETLYTTTQDLVRHFLLVLNRQQDLTLQCLSFRLDFNEYYHQKDSRLSQPLTFQHRRLSSNAFTPLNMSGSFTASPLVTSMSIPETSED